ncbi:MAG: hypothetical protein GXY42_04605 [Desulfovibrionales bacterium]|nr:hypothetical protein [Desulfovibrionales bacterium]
MNRCSVGPGIIGDSDRMSGLSGPEFPLGSPPDSGRSTTAGELARTPDSTGTDRNSVRMSTECSLDFSPACILDC